LEFKEMFCVLHVIAPLDRDPDVPKQKYKEVVARPNVFTVPFNVPVALPTAVAAVVTTAGATGVIMNVWSIGDAGA
jgi:hypothetical protein